jgi:hypothetical protein
MNDFDEVRTHPPKPLGHEASVATIWIFFIAEETDPLAGDPIEDLLENIAALVQQQGEHPCESGEVQAVA